MIYMREVTEGLETHILAVRSMYLAPVAIAGKHNSYCPLEVRVVAMFAHCCTASPQPNVEIRRPGKTCSHQVLWQVSWNYSCHPRLLIIRRLL